MCPRRVATNLPVRPSHRRTLLSHAALAAHRPSGLNATCATCRWCPVKRAKGFSFPPFEAAISEDCLESEREGKSDHKNSVWSSEPVIMSSDAEETRALYRSKARDCAVRKHQYICLSQTYDNVPSSSEDGIFPVWSNGPVRRTKSVFRESVVTQWAWSFSVWSSFP